MNLFFNDLPANYKWVNEPEIYTDTTYSTNNIDKAVEKLINDLKENCEEDGYNTASNLTIQFVQEQSYDHYTVFLMCEVGKAMVAKERG